MIVTAENMGSLGVAGQGREKVDDELNMVFGPGAAALAAAYEGGTQSLDESSELDKSGTSKEVSSTPLRIIPRGRTRLRESGRSSASSPSPVRPRLDSNVEPYLDPGGSSQQGLDIVGSRDGKEPSGEGLGLECSGKLAMETELVDVDMKRIDEGDLKDVSS